MQMASGGQQQHTAKKQTLRQQNLQGLQAVGSGAVLLLLGRQAGDSRKGQTEEAEGVVGVAGGMAAGVEAQTTSGGSCKVRFWGAVIGVCRASGCMLVLSASCRCQTAGGGEQAQGLERAGGCGGGRGSCGRGVPQQPHHVL
jgi:hypothetical protein